MTLPALALMRASLPDARFRLYAPHPLTARVWRLSGLVSADQVFGLPPQKRGLLREFASVRRLQADAVVLWSGGFVWGLAAQLTRAPLRVGLASDGRSFLLSHPLPPQKAGTHQTIVCLEIARLAIQALGIRPNEDLSVPEGPGVRFLLPFASGIKRDAGLLLVIPGASREDKMWPAAHFRSLILAALETGLVREVIVTGSPAESTLCQNLVAACDHPAVRAYNDELEALAKFYVTAGYALGNSTGLMHLAALAGCRVLSLSEETGVDRAAPPGKGNYSLGPPVRQKNGSRQILAAILPQVVLDQLGTMIAEGSVLE